MILSIFYAGEAIRRTAMKDSGNCLISSGVLRSTSTLMKIGMESTGIYHIPLYNHLIADGFPVRILNGIEVRGMKKSRVRKTTNDTIDADVNALRKVYKIVKLDVPLPVDYLN